MPEKCKIEMDFITTDDIGDFGILLRSDDRSDNYYAIKFDPKHNRVAFDCRPRREDCIYIQVDTERYCPLQVGEGNHVTIIVEGSVMELYVNDRVAMSARMFNHTEGCFGLYAQNTTVFFENIQMYGN